MTTIMLTPAPDHVEIDLGGFPDATVTVSVERAADGQVMFVRGAKGQPVAGSGALFTDFEAPMGPEVTYTATTFAADGAVLDTVRASITLDGPRFPFVCISDPLEEGSARLYRAEEATDPQRSWTAPVAKAHPSGVDYPRLSVGVRHVDDWTLTIITSGNETDEFRAFVRNAAWLLIRPPVGIGLDPLIYGVPATVTEKPYVRDDASVWQIPLARSGGPAVHVLSPAWSYGDLASLDMTYGEAAIQFATYRDLQRGPD